MVKTALFCAPFLFCVSVLAALPAFPQSATVSPTTLSFGNQAQGTTSAVKKVTLENGQTSAITITNISTNLSDYGQTNTCPVSPATLAAGVSCTISVTFTPSAQGARNATLTVTDTGLSSPQTVSLTGTGTAPILESIAVTPNPGSVIVAETLQFTATGTYSDGSTQNLTTTASWTSSSTPTATVGLHTGLAKGVAAGTATITASSGKVNGSAPLTVTAATLTSISVTPATASVAAGKTEQYTATGTYNNGTTQNLTNSVTWSSSSTSVATINSSGLATTIVPGSTTITATSGTISGSATLTVTAAVLTSIAVTPAAASIVVGSTQQFTATGTYSNGTTQNLTTTASWTSSALSVASVGKHTGVATGDAPGTTTITASSGSIKGTAALTVTPSLVSIAVTPSTASIAPGTTQQFTATGTYSNGSTQNLTSSVTWASSNTAVATVSSGGLASGVAPGAATITASSGTISGSAALTVTSATLTSLSISPSSASIASGGSQQFTATGTFSDGSTQNVTNSVAWSSAPVSVATITSGGLATGAGAGTATISASSGSINSSATLTIGSATLVSVAVTPASPSFALGTTLPLSATGTYSDGSTLNLTAAATWSTANSSVATVNHQGVAGSVAAGSTSITATLGSVSGSTTVTVTSASLVSIAVTPAIPTFPSGATQQFTATGAFSDGTTQNITPVVEWSSGTPAVATISNAAATPGLAATVAQGSSTITATLDSVTGSTALTVTSASLVSVAVTPTAPSIAPGTTEQFTAIGTYSDNSTQNLTNSVTWSSGTLSTATISNSGLVTSLAPGAATITATLESISGSTSLTVTSATLVSIAINPTSANLPLGMTQQFTATGTFSDGTTQDLTQAGYWTSTSAAVATISDTPGSAGLSSTVGAGTATITITYGSVSASATLTVNSIALTSIAVNPQSATIALGTTQQFTATGTYADSSTQNLTSVVTWSSSAATVAIIGSQTGTQGLATSSGPGTATISATLNSISGSASLTVNGTSPTLVSIAITPTNPSILAGTTQQFAATGTYSDGSTQTITNSVTWSSSNTNVATISNTGTPGLASGVSAGTVTITATLGSVSGTTNLTVSLVLVSITLSPQSPLTAVGATEQFTATGNYSDGSTQNLTTSVTWTSESPSVATISNSAGSQGLAQCIAQGTSTITASFDSLSASTELTVDPLWPAQSWTLHGPSGRNSHSAVWDPTSAQMIIFGGQQATTNTNLNDVWLGTTSTSQNDSFTAESPSGAAPEGRYGHVATYDSNSNRMMIFGGRTGTSSSCANDVWILTGANGQNGTPAWVSVTPSGNPPPARVYSGGVYDPATNSMIIFGGSNCSGGYFNDVWVLSNANGVSGTSSWTELAPSGTAPSARESASAVYDSTHNVLMLYAGDAGGLPFGDVWVLSNANGTGGTPVWTELLPTGTAPNVRTGHTAIFDSVNDRMTIFGGIYQGVTLSDAWVLTFANGIGGAPAWSEISAQGTAPSVAYHSAVYDSSKNNMYVFGGVSSQSKLGGNNHAFTLQSANGISSGGIKWFLGGPAVRYSHSAFYDAVTNGLFIFGGQHSGDAIDFNDYWEEAPVLGSTNLQWTPLTTKGTKPTARFGHTGLYDSGSNRMMIFGGATGFPSPCMNDYYVLEQANGAGGTWLTITAAGTLPPVRMRQASVYDSSTNTIILFGGYNCSSTYYNDVWILSNANDVSGEPTWTQLQPTGTPPSSRESSSAIYDPNTNSLVVYGGDAGGEPMGDIWILSHANGTGGTPAWAQLSPSNGGPVARSGHTATYDSTNNIMTIYAGFDGTNILDDAWVLSGANGQAGSATWTQLLAGQAVRFHTSNYDPATNQMITYGGATSVEPEDPTSDVYTLTDANDLP